MTRTNKNQIIKTLKSGGYVRVESFGYDVKYKLLDSEKNVIGTINFNTYLKLDLIKIKHLHTFHYEYYQDTEFFKNW